MSDNIVNVLYNDYVKPFKTHAMVLIVVIIFVIACIFAYKWFIKPTVESLGESDMSNNNRRSSEAQIYFFSADWCPHCKRAKPEWEKFKTAFDNKTIGTYTMKTISVDCTEGDDPLIQEYSIDGYPTVVMMKDNKRINYDAKISFDNLDKFVTDLTQ